MVYSINVTIHETEKKMSLLLFVYFISVNFNLKNKKRLPGYFFIAGIFIIFGPCENISYYEKIEKAKEHK